MKQTIKGELIRLPVLELRPGEDLSALFNRRAILRVELAAADAHLNIVFKACDLSEEGERIFQEALQWRRAAFMALYGHERPVQGVHYVYWGMPLCLNCGLILDEHGQCENCEGD